MLEVKAHILHRSVFIPDENIDCELTLTYHGREKKGTTDVAHYNHGQATSDTSVIAPDIRIKSTSEDKIHIPDTVNLAWASAQIYCQCDINERRLLIPTNIQGQKNEQSQITSFSPVMGERGHCLLSTNARVIFCDLRLKKGETKKYLYSEKLPTDIPPSYKGHNIKFSYKLCVGIGRIGQPLCLLRLPFRSFGLKGILNALRQKSTSIDTKEDDVLPPEYSSSPVSTQACTTIENPFLEDNLTNSYSTLDLAMDALTTFTVKRNLNTYNIQSASGPVGKFCLSKHYYRLGEDILGTFDLSDSIVKCIKYVVSLQIEEIISKDCLIQPSNSNLVHYVTVSRYEECCYLAAKTNFLLPIPVTSTPEFNHKIVSVKWRLHFEFTIESNGTNKTPDKTDNTSTTNSIPKNLKSEFMLWNLPIHVVATNPILASLMMQAESSETIMLKPF